MVKNTMQATRAIDGNPGQVLEYIITYFVPSVQPLLQRYPKSFRILGVLLVLWYCAPLATIQAFWSRFSRFFISTIEVSIEEDVFHHLLAWIAEQRTLRTDKKLLAMSNKPPDNPKRRRQEADSEELSRKQPDDQLKYEQSQGLQIFVHKRRLFFASRTPMEGHTYSLNRVRKMEILSISCLGRSPEPVRELVEFVYRSNKEKEKSMTIIRRPFSGAGARAGFNWSRLTSKLPRSLDTVILDSEQKEAVLDDIREYMTDTTRAFYADHGIPYRRGYMLYGPPGTGKTSLVMAIASHFGLDVYVLTLLDHNIQDADLMSLMNQLPSPSILLLEDLDTAGLSRKKQVADTTDALRPINEMGDPTTMQKSQGSQNQDSGSDEDAQLRPRTRVSLSGLLNAIDGVAAPEGHILIMTTNRPYELDDALARAGRVSVTVPFTNATKKQTEELFIRMYVDVKGKDESSQSDTSSKNARTSSLARKFAEAIPEGQFSPADLQDYLLTHKRDAQRAIDGLDKWISHKQNELKRKRDARQARRSASTRQVKENV